MTRYVYLLWLLVIALIPLTAHAEEETSRLRFYNQELGRYIDAPGIASEIRTAINGTIARTHVVQYFFNDTDNWQEGIYTYPLPEDSSVDKLVMIIGEKRILGFVAEKEEARKIYEKAKQEGKAAGLVEQHRPNLFRNTVANIPPRSMVAVEIAYQHEVKIDGDLLSLHLPLAVTPRYDQFGIEDFITLASSEPDGSKARDLAERLSLFDFEDGQNPVNMELTLDAGFVPENPRSTSHDILITPAGDNKVKIRTAENILPGEQDFILEWNAPAVQEALTFAHSEEIEGSHYTHVVIMPPATVSSDQPAPKRQVTLIIDTSGSMSGPSIVQAKSALREALYDLKTHDYFNVIRFESETEALFDQTVPASADNIKSALRWIDRLEADGGTEMFPSVEMALNEPEIEGMLRQIVFITDGAIGYEDRLGAYIRDNVGNARFFAVGIGAAPNTHLMSSFAQMGRGTFTFIADVKETEDKMKALFRKMKAPVLTDLELKIPGQEDVEIVPAKLPDLMAGEPVSVALKSAAPIRKLRFHGFKGEDKWLHKLDLPKDMNAEGIGKIYARRKMQDIKFSDPMSQHPETIAQITALGIEHQLVSAQTSLVAVDEEILRPKNAILLSKRYNPNLPKGWQLAEYDPREAAADYKEMLRRQKEDAAQQSLEQKINLPQGGTGYILRILGGLVFIVAALVMGWRKENVFA